jgi:LPS-assembly lipoprotein
MVLRAITLGLLILLSGCGFRPVYATAEGESAIGPVELSMIEGKAGHVLRAELTRMLAAEDSDAPPMLLAIVLRESISGLGYAIDGSSTRIELRLTANYVLTPTNGARMRGSVNTAVTYDQPASAFGEFAAQDDARERAAETLARRIRSELAIRMAGHREAATQ